MVEQIERIKKNMLKIGVKYPFFLYLMSYCDFKRDDTIPTMGVSQQGVVLYNEAFTTKLKGNELRGVLIHEIMHLVYNHISSEHLTKNHLVHNIACDVKVNETIEKDMRQHDIALPDDCIKTNWNDKCELKGLDYTIEKVSTKNSDQIYYELMKFFDSDKFNDKLQGLQFDDHQKGDDNPNLTDKQKSDLPAFWSEKVLEGYEFQKGKGDMPGFLSDLIKGIEMPTIDWRDAIRDRVQGYNISDYTYLKRHKNSRATGVYLPDMIKESIKCRVYFDTSGSVSNQELNQYLSEVKDIFQQFPNAYVEIVTFDTEINNRVVLDENCNEIDCKGRGGTDFRAVFSDDDIEDIDFLVIFSDGEAPYPSNRSNFYGEVLWAITKGNKSDHLQGDSSIDTIIEVKVDAL